MQVIVDAIINSGPREDATRIGSGGVIRRQAVDISPLRRVNQAIFLITTGAREAAFRNIKTIAECLADEVRLEEIYVLVFFLPPSYVGRGAAAARVGPPPSSRPSTHAPPSVRFHLRSSLTRPRAPPTRTPSRRRTSWSAWPRPTASLGREPKLQRGGGRGGRAAPRIYLPKYKYFFTRARGAVSAASLGLYGDDGDAHCTTFCSLGEARKP